MVEIVKIAVEEGYEDISKIRQDSTVVKSNIHYPTNNALVWDCIKESHRLLTHLKEEVRTFSFIDYTKSAKSTYFKINVTKSKDEQVDLFNKQLITFTKAINQVSNSVKKKFIGLKAYIIVTQLQALIPTMDQVYSMAYQKQIEGESVPNDQKLFSIYEQHTDIIVKGSREVLFGHKVNLATGKSNLIIDCHIPKGNPSDKTLFAPHGCETGQAKITKGYNLPAKYVIHTVGPVWHDGSNNESGLLASCYRNCLKIAVENHIKTIAFPSISTGIYGYPIEEASEIALKEIIHFLETHTEIEKVILVCFGERPFNLYNENLKKLILNR